MKRTLGFMLMLCLFGLAVTASAAPVAELTDDQMAQQFGGCIFDPETTCDYYGGWDYSTGIWWGLLTGYCEPTGLECDHGANTDEYAVVCLCYTNYVTYFYACESEDPVYAMTYEDLEDYIDMYFGGGIIMTFDEDDYPLGGYPPWPPY